MQAQEEFQEFLLVHSGLILPVDNFMCMVSVSHSVSQSADVLYNCMVSVSHSVSQSADVLYNCTGTMPMCMVSVSLSLSVS